MERHALTGRSSGRLTRGAHRHEGRRRRTQSRVRQRISRNRSPQTAIRPSNTADTHRGNDQHRTGLKSSYRTEGEFCPVWLGFRLGNWPPRVRSSARCRSFSDVGSPPAKNIQGAYCRCADLFLALDPNFLTKRPPLRCKVYSGSRSLPGEPAGGDVVRGGGGRGVRPLREEIVRRLRTVKGGG